MDLFDPREAKARRALEEWESQNYHDYLKYDRSFRSASRKLAEEYSWLVEDWVTGYDLLAKPPIATKAAKEAKAFFGKEAAKATLEGIEAFSDVLFALPPYVERLMARRLTYENVSVAVGKRFSSSRNLLLGFSGFLPKRLKEYCEHEKRYYDVVEELSRSYGKKISEEDINSAVRSVFRDKENYLNFKKEGDGKLVKCVEYFEGLIGKAAAENVAAIAFFGSLRPLKRFLAELSETEQKIEERRAEEIF